MRACSLPHTPPRASPSRAPLGRSLHAAPSAVAAPLVCLRLALPPPRLALAPQRRRATASSIAAAASSGATKPAATPPPVGATGLGFQGVHHVAVICANLEASLDFYCGTLGAQPIRNATRSSARRKTLTRAALCATGLPINPDRPEKNLPYRGAWLWVGALPTLSHSPLIQRFKLILLRPSPLCVLRR
jgi:hypothetical protein